MKKNERMTTAAYIVKIILHVQKKFVHVMTKLAVRHSVKMLKIYCIAWAVLFATICTLIIVRSFKPENVKIITYDPIPRPLIIDSEGLSARADKAVYKRISATKIWLDSIRKTHITGDSIRLPALRPGLYDSIVLAEKLYNNN